MLRLKNKIAKIRSLNKETSILKFKKGLGLN